MKMSNVFISLLMSLYSIALSAQSSSLECLNESGVRTYEENSWGYVFNKNDATSKEDLVETMQLVGKSGLKFYAIKVGPALVGSLTMNTAGLDSQSLAVARSRVLKILEGIAALEGNAIGCNPSRGPHPATGVHN